MDNPSVQTLQLHHWLERIRAGDLSARDELLRSFCGRLECLARKMLRRFPQVQRWAQTGDVLQNALLRLLRSLQKVEPASVRDFLGLAAVEMRRELLDLVRHFYGPLGLGAHHSSQGPDSDHAGAEHALAVQEDQDDLERWQAFHEGVEGLPAEEREVVSLIFYHGWTQVDVAELFQASERTIRRRWESALLKLHQRLNLREQDT
jgi:RNA polymerase sigma factor (sigma-70 family)